MMRIRVQGGLGLDAKMNETISPTCTTRKDGKDGKGASSALTPVWMHVLVLVTDVGFRRWSEDGWVQLC